MVFADAGLLKHVAMGADLEALRDGREPQFAGNGAAVPLHERGADFEDFIAVHANHLGHLGVVGGVGQVVFDVGSNIDLSQQRALGHDGQRAIDGGARYGIIDGANVIEQFFGGEMLLASERRLENSQTLVRHAEAFGGKVGFEFFAGGGVTHSENLSFVRRTVNWFVGA